jgi:hypothetical protein
LAPQVGLEPTTLRLTAECSAIELLRISQACAASFAFAAQLLSYNKRTPEGQSGPSGTLALSRAVQVDDPDAHISVLYESACERNGQIEPSWTRASRVKVDGAFAFF